MANDDDPELREMTELGRIERRQLGPLRARHILIGTAVLVVIGLVVVFAIQHS